MKMSKIGLKIIAVFLVILIVAIISVTMIALIRSSGIISDMMREQTTSGIKTIQYEFQNEFVHLKSVTEMMNAFDLNLQQTASSGSINKAWDSLKRSEDEFLAFMNSSGEIYWQSDSYNLKDFKHTSVGEGFSGIVKDSAANLTLQYATPIKRGGTVIGYAVIGRHLSDLTWIDEISMQTNSEITIFGDNVRIGTTVLNDQGQRALGTTMSDSVAKIVLTNGERYVGQTQILGKNHYVCYEPIDDINGNIVGAIFSGVSAESSEAAERTMILIVVITALVIALVSVSIITYIVNRMINAPVREANALAGDMSRGILDRPASNFKFANDEIGDFVRKLESTKNDLNGYIGDINYVLSEMATGDFTVQPRVAYVGDFVEIRESFEKIEKSLKGIIMSISNSAQTVKGGAEQIADASSILADGTTRQAASIEELSASINEVANKVNLSADNCGEASKVAMLSREKISSQNEEVHNLMEAMSEIKERSDQIQNIIQAIDDIAFQTNILALNAAIEAARAGAAGKGFAVVADEVRNLAAKSAASAAQTGELITATIDAVHNGTTIAKSTADIMKEVTELSNETNRYIAEIAKAAEDQSESVSQIKNGIEAISSVVQQNSATAEETAAECANLSDQSVVLEEQIAKLKV